MRDSSVLGIVRRIQAAGIKIIVYEPLLKEESLLNTSKVVNNLDQFKKQADVIIANRLTKDLLDVSEKIFSRDIYFMDE